ncbi:hypothetical protein BV898_18894 [Hypsibius exemplaris]|uniref:Uncharacterized protein n=1 Tax=Hypsibius exemplaris TaxID=2072580 RepID=A0A9X6NJP0_HYPEX|nr:hypothetical protein BV898_18894 [Hypsibius exemplaris]
MFRESPPDAILLRDAEACDVMDVGREDELFGRDCEQPAAVRCRSLRERGRGVVILQDEFVKVFNQVGQGPQQADNKSARMNRAVRGI